MARACPSTTGRSKKSQFQCNDVFPLRIVGSNYGLFGVSEESGKLELTASPDREQRDMYILRVKVAVAFCCEVIHSLIMGLFQSNDSKLSKSLALTLAVNE